MPSRSCQFASALTTATMEDNFRYDCNAWGQSVGCPSTKSKPVGCKSWAHVTVEKDPSWYSLRGLGLCWLCFASPAFAYLGTLTTRYHKDHETTSTSRCLLKRPAAACYNQAIIMVFKGALKYKAVVTARLLRNHLKLCPGSEAVTALVAAVTQYLVPASGRADNKESTDHATLNKCDKYNPKRCIFTPNVDQF